MIKKDTLNLTSLTVIQASNAILPLIIFPYVLNVLGAVKYSDIVITESIMFIIFTFVLYSFEVNGVSEIVQMKDKEDTKKLSLIFSKIITIRIIVLSFFVIVLLFIKVFFDNSFFILLLTWMLFPLSYILQSSYLFLALEKNFFLAISVVLSRVLAIFCVFYFIDKSDQSFLIPLIIGASFLLGSICSFLYAIIKFKLRFYRVTLKEIKKGLNDGKEIFFGNISVILFKGINVLILGVLTNNAFSISIYSIAEKIIKSLQAAIRPLNSLFFPKGVKLIKNIALPSKKAFFLLSKITIPQLIVLTILTVIFFVTIIVFGHKIPLLNKIPNLALVITLCGIMVLSVFLGVSNFMYGTVGLNHLQSKRYYAKSIFMTGVISIILSFVLIKVYHETGAAISYVVGEAILLFFVLKKIFK